MAKLFEAGGIRCALTDNIVSMRWQKCLWNATINPISVLQGCQDTHALLSDAAIEKLVSSAMNEVLLIASAAGHPIPKSMIQLNIESTKRMPPYKTSMALDYSAGRPMEVEAILGNTVRNGRRLNITIPVLEELYSAISKIS